MVPTKVKNCVNGMPKDNYFRHMMACTFLDSGLNSAVAFVSFDFQALEVITLPICV